MRKVTFSFTFFLFFNICLDASQKSLLFTCYIASRASFLTCTDKSRRKVLLAFYIKNKIKIKIKIGVLDWIWAEKVGDGTGNGSKPSESDDQMTAKWFPEFQVFTFQPPRVSPGIFIFYNIFYNFIYHIFHRCYRAWMMFAKIL